MPVYEFVCDTCKIKNEIKLTMVQHSAIKNDINCEKCGEKMYQAVAPLNFRLVGDCWFSRGAGNNSHGVGYEMTNREMEKGRQDVAKMDDVVAEMEAKDNNRSEI